VHLWREHVSCAAPSFLLAKTRIALLRGLGINHSKLSHSSLKYYLNRDKRLRFVAKEVRYEFFFPDEVQSVVEVDLEKVQKRPSGLVGVQFVELAEGHK